MPDFPGIEGDPENRYANVFKIGFNAYEFVLDFGQHYQPAAERFHTRIITNAAMISSLHDVLSQSLREYERQRAEKEK